FPSLGEIQSEVVGWTASLLHGDARVAGFLTSGGTESIQCAVKAARERARAERGVTAPELVLAASAHAAFHKAAHDFGLKTHTVPVRADFRADVAAMAARVNANTALIVGSAPQYPQGVIDPIPELAEIATQSGASLHVDACMGGFVLPFAERLGHAVPPWDFRVPGVTTISADLHKLGYAPKGASVILHRNKQLRKYQTFVFDGWLGGLYASPNLQGSRAGLPMACAWAVMQRLGLEGYERLTRATFAARDRMLAAIGSVPGLQVLGAPDAHVVAFSAAPGGPLDVFALGDALLARGGWFHDRQAPPDSLHSTLSAGNAPVIDEWARDLAACAAELAGRRAADRSTVYATLE
ncbi:MAG TPA: aminotransferase class V-fold PLP-dependent enzyme, partial [Myxococcota bacterium]|nr:aminotransferase class V-fold PLP-dependent enzyme [Myxococcota bacterium]